MYPVSNAYKQKILEDGRVTRITGTITLRDNTVINITNDDIAILPSFNNQCSGDSELILGQAYQGELEFGIYSDISRYSIYGARCELVFELLIDEEEDEWEPVPLGVYKVSDCIRQSTDQLKITALDNMDLLNKKYDGFQLTGTPYGILSDIATATGLVLGQTEEDIEGLPNGDAILGIEINSDVSTYRDIVGDLAACMCGFAEIGRDGKLYIRSFATESCATITDDYRGNDTISDYQVIYSCVCVTKAGELVIVGDDQGQTLDLGANVFLQYGLPETTIGLLENILDVVGAVHYTPADLSLKCSDPAYDLGDLIESTGYTSGTSILVPIHKINWKWRSELKISAVGKNPYLDPTTKTDKEMATLLSRVDEQSMTFYLAKNASQIRLENNLETVVSSIKFAAKKETDVEIWFEAKIDIDRILSTTQVPVYSEEEVIDPETGEPVIDPDTGEPETEVVQSGWWNRSSGETVATIFYYYDDVLVDYEPVETWDEDGLHTIHYGYFLPTVTNTTSHTFKAKMLLSGGTGLIDIGDCRMILRGQALVGSEIWNGEIEVADELGMYDIKAISAKELEDDDISVATQTPTSVTVSDSVVLQDVASIEPKEVEESTVSVVLRNIVFRLVSEDGNYNIVSEDGDYNITTEGNDD
ncbi:MAG: hypothetical protein K6A80_01555 [Saccharofermentans sp.]|nr:hypothetical protein [Saccharofermentans sp.]